MLIGQEQGCHLVREKRKIFKVREKSGKSQGKSQFLSKSGNFLEFRVKSQGILWNSGNSRDFERKAFEMPCVQIPVKNVKRLNMKRRILMVYRRN